MVSSSLLKAPRTMPVAAVLTVGNELLSGRTLNSNAAFLGAELTQLGFEVREHQVCADETKAIQEVLERLKFAQVLVVTGGLGPTPDDVTRDAIAAYFSVPLSFSKDQFKAMCAIYKKLGRKLPTLSRREAFYPANACPLVNRFGIALGFSIAEFDRLIIVLPGVPTEMQKMFAGEVKPLLRRRFKKIAVDKMLIARTVGISEPRIMEKLGNDFFNEPFQFGIYPSEGETQICIRSPSASIIRRARKKIKSRLGGSIYAWDDSPLAKIVGDILLKTKKKISIAESCTGGGLAFAFTRISGASRFFCGSVTAYQVSAKKKLGIDARQLKKQGVVSAEVAAELAWKACSFFNSDYGIGVTGVAGPGGGSAKNPVGQVYIAIADGADVQVERHLFWGNREQIQRKAVVKALEQVWRLIRRP